MTTKTPTNHNTSQHHTNDVEVATVRLACLEAGKHNPRREKDRLALEGLASSIREDGVLQNLIIQPNGGESPPETKPSEDADAST